MNRATRGVLVLPFLTGTEPMPTRNNIAFRSAKPRQKPFKLSDGGGLYLLVQPNAAKLWRLAYRFDGKQKLLALGPYPVTSALRDLNPPAWYAFKTSFNRR
jgi:hypothetical protein